MLVIDFLSSHGHLVFEFDKEIANPYQKLLKEFQVLLIGYQVFIIICNVEGLDMGLDVRVKFSSDPLDQKVDLINQESHSFDFKIPNTLETDGSGSSDICGKAELELLNDQDFISISEFDENEGFQTVTINVPADFVDSL